MNHLEVTNGINEIIAPYLETYVMRPEGSISISWDTVNMLVSVRKELLEHLPEDQRHKVKKIIEDYNSQPRYQRL